MTTSDRQDKQPHKAGATPRPLAGLRVLDLSRILSGPFCTMLLADMGAEVIKVERPVQGDVARGMGPRAGGDAAYFMSVNRGKKSVTIDLAKPEGQRLARELARRSDALVENFVPGAAARMGLDYASLRDVNPRLVYCSISGFGQDGPYAKLPALDVIVQAMGGIMSVTGEQGGPPIRPGASLGDSVAGTFAALAIVSALWERERTRVGRHIDVSMLDCQVTMMENAFARYFATGQVPSPLGSRHPAAAPFQAFATADGWIAVAMLTDERGPWERFCRAIGRPELVDDERFRDNMARVRNYEALRPALEEGMRRKTTRAWMEELTALGIPCGPVNNMAQVADDPQVRHRGMVREVPHPKLGTWRVANTPFRFDGVGASPRDGSPALGEHTEEVLREMLGLSVEEIKTLRKGGVT